LSCYNFLGHGGIKDIGAEALWRQYLPPKIIFPRQKEKKKKHSEREFVLEKVDNPIARKTHSPCVHVKV